MAKKPSSDLQVIIPYQEFLDLLKAAQSVEDLTAANIRLNEQQSALRNQFTELLEAFQDLRDFVKD